MHTQRPSGPKEVKASCDISEEGGSRSRPLGSDRLRLVVLNGAAGLGWAGLESSGPSAAAPSPTGRPGEGASPARADCRHDPVLLPPPGRPRSSVQGEGGRAAGARAGGGGLRKGRTEKRERSGRRGRRSTGRAACGAAGVRKKGRAWIAREEGG